MSKYAPAVKTVLAKLTQRYAMRDQDLCGISGSGLCVLLWDRIAATNEPEAYVHFAETLEDVGGTCLQGDTHRLFFSLVTYERLRDQSL